MKAIVVVTTVGTQEQANLLAEELVIGRLASCVNVLPVHRSVYLWQGKVCDDQELLLIIKTTKRQYGQVEATIQELHNYDLPEILAFDVTLGEKHFLNWINETVTGVPDPSDEVIFRQDPVDASDAPV